MHTKTVYLDNRNRDSGTATDYQKRIVPVRAKRILIPSCNIPFTWFPINSTNDDLDFTDSVDGALVASITPGHYNGADLATEIQTQMNAVSTSVYTCVYSATTAKMTITNTTGVRTVVLNFSVANTIADIIGFSPTDTADLTTHVSDGVVNLTGEDYILLGSNLAIDSVIEGRHGILLKIPITYNWGSTIFYENDTLYHSIDEVISDIRLTLMDKNGNILDLHGRSWGLTIKIFYD